MCLPVAGVVKEVKVKLGDKISEGTVVVMVETGAAVARLRRAGARRPGPAPAHRLLPPLPRHRQRPPARSVKVPDIGDSSDVPVIDVFVKVGDTIKVDDALVTLESGQGDDGRALVRRRRRQGSEGQAGRQGFSEGASSSSRPRSGAPRGCGPAAAAPAPAPAAAPAPPQHPRRLPLPRSLSPRPAASAARPRQPSVRTPMPANWGCRSAKVKATGPKGRILRKTSPPSSGA